MISREKRWIQIRMKSIWQDYVFRAIISVPHGMLFCDTAEELQ